MPSPLLLDDAQAVVSARAVVASRALRNGRPVTARWDPNAAFWQVLVTSDALHPEGDALDLGAGLEVVAAANASLPVAPLPAGWRRVWGTPACPWPKGPATRQR